MYGLSESGYYWVRTFRKRLENELGMKLCISDTSLFFKVLDEKVIGLFASYVDDTLHAANFEYCQLSKTT